MKAIGGLALLAVLLCLQSCNQYQNGFESWRSSRISGKSPAATDTGVSHPQSLEGKLDNAKGTISSRNGYFYLFSSNGKRWDLNKQEDAKKFSGVPVSIWGYFNYNKNMIDIVKIYPAKR
jgi:hypothetical protein